MQKASKNCMFSTYTKSGSWLAVNVILLPATFTSTVNMHVPISWANIERAVVMMTCVTYLFPFVTKTS